MTHRRFNAIFQLVLSLIVIVAGLALFAVEFWFWLHS
jgi:hypothetical protein